MENRDRNLKTPNVERESPRRSGSDSYGSSSSRSGSSGDMGQSGISRDESSRRGSSPMENDRSSSKRDDISGSDDVGRHSE